MVDAPETGDQASRQRDLDREQAIADLEQSIADRHQVDTQEDQEVEDHEHPPVAPTPLSGSRSGPGTRHQDILDHTQAKHSRHQRRLDRAQTGRSIRQDALDAAFPEAEAHAEARPGHAAPTADFQAHERDDAALTRADAAVERAQLALERAEAARGRIELPTIGYSLPIDVAVLLGEGGTSAFSIQRLPQTSGLSRKAGSALMP